MHFFLHHRNGTVYLSSEDSLVDVFITEIEGNSWELVIIVGDESSVFPTQLAHFHGKIHSLNQTY